MVTANDKYSYSGYNKVVVVETDNGKYGIPFQ